MYTATQMQTDMYGNKVQNRDIDSQTCFKRAKYDVQRDRHEFSTANIAHMQDLRNRMNEQILLWALFSFNNVENGACGGVYEILERDEIIYISGIPPDVHVRDALNGHFSGDDDLQLGQYLLSQSGPCWRNYYVRFMVSDSPREDARLLLRNYQLQNKGRLPRFN